MTGWIDISVPLQNGMVHWPGDPAYQIELALDQKKGDVCTVSHVSMGVHTGTHMDAPRHFIEDAATIDELLLDAVIGPARVIAIRDRKCIGREELEEHDMQDGVETHHALLGAGVWVIEGLNLHSVEPGAYELICLPLKMAGAEGATARAVLRKMP
jgi:arylformamidase